MARSTARIFRQTRGSSGSRVRPAACGWHETQIGVIVQPAAAVLGFHLATQDDIRQLPEGVAAGIEDADGSLLALCASGDLEAFAMLVDRHQAMVVAVANRMLNGAGDADDIAQEALLRLWRSSSTLEMQNAAGAGPWLRRVVTNMCIDRLRSQGRLRPLDEIVGELAEPASQLAFMTRQETAANVERAIRNLPDRQRLALALFHFEELSLAVIAIRLEVTVDAVESLLARARRTLKRDLDSEWREFLEDTS